MEVKSYSLGITAKFLARNTQEFTAFSFNDSAILLFNKNIQVKYSYENIVGNIELNSGLLWSELSWNLRNDSVIRFGWINKKIAKQLQAEINSEIFRFYKTYFKEAAQQITNVYSHFQKLKRHDRYFRYSHAQEWLVNHQDVKGLTAREERAKYLDSKINSQADELHQFFSKSEAYRRSWNDKFISNKKADYQQFFDQLESNPLTEAQRTACIEDEDANLVLAGAGTGKTSAIVGKAGYLVESQSAKPEEILMLAFARKAADEMQERVEQRIGENDLTVKTFHGLGKEIIAKVEGKQPSLTKLAEDEKLRIKFIQHVLSELLLLEDYRRKLINYFANYLYPVKNVFDFTKKQEYIEYCQQVELRALDGSLVKSHEELTIANFLYQKGINFEYEADYIIDTSGPDFRKYKPDFYLPDYEIYIEHFALDENGNTPAFIDAAIYLAGVEWKRSLHHHHGTQLIESYSYEHQQGKLLENLEESLISAGVIFEPLPENKMLELIKELGEVTSFSTLISEFLKLFKAALLSLKELYGMAADHADRARMKVVVELFEPIYQKYQSYLDSRNEIDFEDMIAKAVDYVEQGLFVSPYRYVLVDEFQDISAPRARLIKALRNQKQECSIFCVGDDWQSIYRFTGSDVSLTRDFSDHFGAAATNILDMTFRFNQRIGEVASRFIQCNPAQIKKEIKSIRDVDGYAVTIIPSSSDATGLEIALVQLNNEAKAGSSVMVLGRFKFIKPDDFSRSKRNYPNLKIEYMTVHSAKGKEADYVIVLGLNEGKNGFPSSKVSNSILSLLLPPEEDYKYAEERRLFYVALTRARHHVYLVTNPEKASEFIRELRDADYPVTELPTDVSNTVSWSIQMQCPECQSGYLVERNNSSSGKIFYACNNYPYCEYTQNGCPKCGNPQFFKYDHLSCSSEQCAFIQPLCPDCGSVLKLRPGKNGRFWGCSRYRKGSDFSCGYTSNYIDLEQLKRNSIWE